MYLKRVEIFGFKSFAEKTELEFGPGITSVVGPNGSGKSNVADAVRWVLGEQSARALRGGHMADVIFAGSDGRKAMGYAQVSLILDNSDNTLSVKFNEVMVTRRVDRSGEGEYFINQVPCRLKDVHDLFLDTGVGRESYSIVGQGKIDEILSNKPEDRRGIFEEAAGISRYKARKREAQRRLEETAQNLLRITDIIGELDHQIETLSHQAGRAETYTCLNAELTRLDLGLLANGLQGAGARLKQHTEETALLQQKLQETEARLNAGEEAAETTRNLAESLDQELSLALTRVTESTGLLERAEGRQALAQQEQRGVQSEIVRLESEVAAMEGKLSRLNQEAAGLRAAADRLQSELAKAVDSLSVCESEFQAAQVQTGDAGRVVEEQKDQIVTILQQEAEKRNAAAAADRAGNESARRLARLDAEREKAEAEAANTRERRKNLGAHQAELASQRAVAAAALDRFRAQRQEAELALHEFQQRGGALREQIQGDSSRLGAIEEMINAFEGYQRGTRTILQAREKGLSFTTDVLGAVAELIRTDPEYEKAVEIALGGSIQNIVTATDTGAQSAIEHLKQSNGGRATFLPLTTIRPAGFRPDEEREFRGADGIVGTALELVRFEERFRPAMASLLGRVLIAGNMASALAFGRRTGMRYRIVTLDGELLAAGGALTGGSTGGQGSGLLSREREREELTHRITALRAELTATRKAHEEEQARLTAVEGQLRETDQELRTVDRAITQSEGEATRLTGEERRWQEVLQTFAAEAALISSEAAEGVTSAQQLRMQLEQLALERSQIEAEVARLNAEGEARVLAMEEKGRAVTALQVKVAELNQELRGLAGQRSRLEADAAALHTERQLKEQQVREAGQRDERVGVELQRAGTEVGEAAVAKAACESERDALQGRKLEVLEQVNARERDLRSIRRSQTETQSKLQQSELEIARLSMEQENLTTRLHEQHGMTPQEIASLALYDAEVADARERSHSLREEIRELGPVNLQAIDEFRAAQERLTFLGAQRDDLEEAKGSLYRAVEELEKRIKTHFLESFLVIRREFQQVYQELFEGGKADLQLVDEQDLLETGIEIIAQPPGKKAQPLSLLSGGERAMTAIALLFALLRVKPSPFVVLDEVEAALDEANVERFGKYLRSFSGQGCQFICITHQRGTMEVADALYGVTMEGTGISKVVSVRLTDFEREAS